MIRLIILILVWTSIAHAKTESCSWDNDVPCVVITKPNTNLINEKVSPSTVITQEQIKKHILKPCFFIIINIDTIISFMILKTESTLPVFLNKLLSKKNSSPKDVRI